MGLRLWGCGYGAVGVGLWGCCTVGLGGTLVLPIAAMKAMKAMQKQPGKDSKHCAGAAAFRLVNRAPLPG